MLSSYVTGVVIVVAVSVIWVAVQLAWKKVFPEVCHDPDVLANRGSCHGCESTEACNRRRAGGAGSAEEEVR